MSFDIEDFSLVQDQQYAFSMNTDGFYSKERTDLGGATYPQSYNNIQINGFGKIEGTAQAFPNNFTNFFIYGDLSFSFILTD